MPAMILLCMHTALHSHAPMCHTLCIILQVSGIAIYHCSGPLDFRLLIVVCCFIVSRLVWSCGGFEGGYRRAQACGFSWRKGAHCLFFHMSLPTCLWVIWHVLYATLPTKYTAIEPCRSPRLSCPSSLLPSCCYSCLVNCGGKRNLLSGAVALLVSSPFFLFFCRFCLRRRFRH